MPLTLISPAFADGSPIPNDYLRDGRNLSPPLKWTGAPAGVRSYLLVMDDVDAPNGTFHHWVVYNIPADRGGLPQSVDTGSESSLRHGKNNFGSQGYDGPDPAHRSGLHHYHYRLYALDVPSLSVHAKAGAEDIVRAARSHILEQAELIGTAQG